MARVHVRVRVKGERDAFVEQEFSSMHSPAYIQSWLSGACAMYGVPVVDVEYSINQEKFHE